ncbi:MAG: biotin carboxylase, partial [Halioglobus sp.]|nr:biotin carboxylase [Halioglobus sp.]
MADEIRPELAAYRERVERTLDEARSAARDKRHAKGYRTARENLIDIVDEGSFQEYGQFAVAAQRSRREYEDLQGATAADGIITGTCTINAATVAAQRSRAAVIINDYAVLAGTQGFFHHKKLDRICELAVEQALP